MNIKNLTKLAKGLLTVSDSQFEMSIFQDIFDVDLFQKAYPNLIKLHEDEDENTTPREKYKYFHLMAQEELNPTFQLQHKCGTSGCALGWATTLVEKGLPGESWMEYSERVFEIGDGPEWSFMFGGTWEDEQNTPKATSKRIMYVVKGNDVKDRDQHFNQAESLL